MKERILIGLLVATALLVYGNSLRNEFTMDDDLYISLNPQVTDATFRGLFTANRNTNVFRPVTFGTFALNWKLGGAHPNGYHLINLLLHGIVTLLLYLLFKTVLSASPHASDIAFAAALLFTVHPIHTEAVASIVGRAELLAAGFLLAGWILHLLDKEVLALLCFALALLSKESAVVFLPLLIVGDLARHQWKSIHRYLRAGALVVLYLAVLWKVQGGRFGSDFTPLDNPIGKIAGGWRALNALRIAWKYVALQFYPATLSCDYSFNQIPVYLDWRHTLPALVGALTAAGVWTWAVRKRQAGIVLAVGMYIAAFAVTSNILMPMGTIMGERLAYLPSAGICLLVALAWNRARQWNQTPALAVLSLAAVALTARTIVRNADWRNNFALYSSAVQAAPKSAKMHANLGSAYVARREFDQARVQLDTALRIYPDFPDALESYGLMESRRGNYQAAGAMMEKAFYMSGRDNANYDYMAVNLAALYIQTGHLDGAMDVLNREIEASPKYTRAWYNRGLVQYKLGNTAAARGDAEMALRLEPHYTQALDLLQRLKNPAPVSIMLDMPPAASSTSSSEKTPSSPPKQD